MQVIYGIYSHNYIVLFSMIIHIIGIAYMIHSSITTEHITIQKLITNNYLKQLIGIVLCGIAMVSYAVCKEYKIEWTSSEVIHPTCTSTDHIKPTLRQAGRRSVAHSLKIPDSLVSAAPTVLMRVGARGI